VRRAANRLAANQSDPDALALLREMLRPAVDYSAEEQTWIAQGGGMTSTQTIKGDTRGFVIRSYVSPPFLRGDAMLTGPNKYLYYSASARTLTEVAPGSGAGDVRDKKIVEGLRQRIFVARRTGNEAVSGVNTVIVLVTPANPQQQGYAKFWIDPVTHIKMKIEIANAGNARISASELSNVVVGPAAGVSPRDFLPAQFAPGVAREVKRERVASMEDAVKELKFRPLEPGTLPPGFHLDSIQVLTGPLRVGLFLRYTDGVSVFTLTEHRVRVGQRPGAALTGTAPHWFVPVGDYDVDVVYRGHLAPPQQQAVRDSLQPVR
jgi:hypothetical protein